MKFPYPEILRLKGLRIYLDHFMIQMPDLVYVLLNRTVGCELSAACHVEHCHPMPSALRRGMLPLRASVASA